MRQGSWFNFSHNVLNKTKGKNTLTRESELQRETQRYIYIEREKEIQINGIIIKQGLQVNFYTRVRKKNQRERERIREREKENQLKKTKKKNNTHKREKERELE